MANSLDALIVQLHRSNDEVDRLRKELADVSDTAKSLSQELDQRTLERNQATQRVAELSRALNDTQANRHSRPVPVSSDRRMQTNLPSAPQVPFERNSLRMHQEPEISAPTMPPSINPAESQGNTFSDTAMSGVSSFHGAHQNSRVIPTRPVVSRAPPAAKLKARGRPKRRAPEDSDIDIILFIGCDTAGSPIYKPFRSAPGPLQEFLKSAIDVAYCDTKQHKSAYQNVVAKQNRQESADRNKRLNMRIYQRKYSLKSGRLYACVHCSRGGRLCARVLDDGHGLKLCIFPVEAPSPVTWEDEGFWLL
jgi:hypothetical protein